MEGLINYILTGLILGITAGISPGPLMAVLISETIKGNIKNGLMVAVIPVITDIPLIILTVFILRKFKDINIILDILYIIGGLTLIYFGIKDLLTNKVNINYNLSKFSSLKKGIITNILNPHPYIFWVFIGVPFIINGNLLQIIGFVASFFTGIVGSKIVIALSVEKSKHFIQSNYYLYLIKLSGIILIIFGILLLLKTG